MSTRARVFVLENIGDNQYRTYSDVYKHWDGYPSGLGHTLAEALTESVHRYSTFTRSHLGMIDHLAAKVVSVTFAISDSVYLNRPSDIQGTVGSQGTLGYTIASEEVGLEEYFYLIYIKADDDGKEALYIDAWTCGLHGAQCILSERVDKAAELLADL